MIVALKNSENQEMNGAESLISTLVNHDIDVCFTNPGTSEMHFVAALDEVEGMRGVLCLFEGVASGAAEGYARMAAKPASTLLHLGPGFGNALANIHNCYKGHSPLLNVVGDHATYHLQYDAPLTSDIEGMAATVSHWVHASTSSEKIAEDGAEAAQRAKAGEVATLILPANVSWGDNPAGAVAAVSPAAPAQVTAQKIDEAIAMLTSGKTTAILAGGRNISSEQGLLLSQISVATGAALMTETFACRVRRGAGNALLDRLPYLAESAIEKLSAVEQLVLVGADAPVGFFAYPNVSSVLWPEGCEILSLAGVDEDIDGALLSLVEGLDIADVAPMVTPLQIPELPSGELNAGSIAATLGHHMPDNAVVVDEAITAGVHCYMNTVTSRPHDWLNLAGGAIGWGLPAAVGAAVACPDRKVICIEGDGSAMYTIQALWTMARENLDIVVVIFNNRKYSVLELEFARTGARGGVPGPVAGPMLDIGAPAIDFVSMAKGMGVHAEQATTAEQFNTLFATAVEHNGPMLIDAIIPPIAMADALASL